MPSLAPFAGRHRSASKDPRFVSGIQAVRSLPSVKRIGLGYLRSTTHGKPIGSFRLSKELTGGFQVYHYSSGAFIELQLYSDDTDKLYEDILGLRSRFVVQDRIGTAEPENDAPEPALAPPIQPDPEPPVPGIPDPLAGIIGRLTAEVSRTRDEHAAALALLAEMERRLAALEHPGGHAIQTCAMTAAAVMARMIEHASAVLPVIAEIREGGAATLQAIADELNNRGVRTSNGCMWQRNTVKRVMDRSAGADPRRPSLPRNGPASGNQSGKAGPAVLPLQAAP